MWVTKLLIFPVEIRIFCPKTTKFGKTPIYFIDILVEATNTGFVNSTNISTNIDTAGFQKKDEKQSFHFHTKCKNLKFSLPIGSGSKLN